MVPGEGASVTRGQSHGRVVLFWDYDTQWGTDADLARGLPVPPRTGHLEFEYTDRLLDLHAEFEVPACFAVVGAAALPGDRPYHDPDQIRRIHGMGHEIASHGFRHEWLPGLDRDRLVEVLRVSKDALEQCLGAPVTSFVPPYNQPFDHGPKGSISLSERRIAGPQRTTLHRLCAALQETGFLFCRVAYRPPHLRLADLVLRRPLDPPSWPEQIAGVTCVRLNTPCGFDSASIAMLRRCALRGGIAVLYGHPHSLGNGHAQDERHLRPLLGEIRALRRSAGLQVCLPRDLAVGA
jgi:peptidoglycan/xylan/chitin deacetylase (PgdA/CDA1 family)